MERLHLSGGCGWGVVREWSAQSPHIMWLGCGYGTFRGSVCLDPGISGGVVVAWSGWVDCLCSLLGRGVT